MIRYSRIGRSGLATAVALAALAPCAAHAEVRREGQWPASEPMVTLDFDGVPRGDALTRLAKAAGWSIVVTAPKGDPVNLHVEKQPADRVLELLLIDGRYIARREQGLIAIAPAGEPSGPAAPPVPPVPPAPPGPPAALPIPPVPPAPPLPPGPSASDDDDDERDRVVTGGSLRIEKGEVAHDITVLGGTLDVWGTVTGDLALFGGSVRIHEGGRVHGDVSVMGGSIDVDSGAAIDGDVGVLGGKLHRADGATIGGDINDGMRKHKAAAKSKARDKQARDEGHAKSEASSTSSVRSLARGVADAVNGAALLFVFGAVLLALAPARMDQLKVQIASRPMRTFATGVVSLLGGAVLLTAVCVTIIGIPIAAVAMLAAIIAVLAGVCSVLETIGAALLAHRTKNPYVHLAVGGLLFLVAGAIPFVGSLVKLAVILTALGSVVATRAAGLLPARLRGASSQREPARDA
ncbi:Hypothetical protein A7982_09987 [Minicystis rosea]|nr:Hypothetical protein A7982_09987 [Minicystis rosea]